MQGNDNLKRAQFIAAVIGILLVLGAWIDTEWQAAKRSRSGLQEMTGFLRIYEDGNVSGKGSASRKRVVVIESVAATRDFHCWRGTTLGDCPTQGDPQELNGKTAK